MANPKHKTSKARRDKRRTHYKAKAPQLVVCPNCGTMHPYHTVCPTCGYYRNQEAITKDNIYKPEEAL